MTADEPRTPQQLYADCQTAIRAALQIVDRLHPEAATPMQVIDLIQCIHSLAAIALKGVALSVELTDQMRRLEEELCRHGGRHQGRIDTDRHHEDRRG